MEKDMGIHAATETNPDGLIGIFDGAAGLFNRLANGVIT
jgi:hypothetical protein